MARILCIDDDSAILMMMEKLLKIAGHTVVAETSARKGLDKAAGGKFDLIILDVMIPDMNGADILKKLKTSESTMHIPVIMLSGRDEEEMKQHAFYEYAENFIVKGTSNKEILAGIEKVLLSKPSG